MLAFAILVLPTSALRAAPIDMAIMGDSLNLLSPDYDISWVVQLQNAGAITPHDYAIDGAESVHVVSFMLPSVVTKAQQGTITDSVLVVGANDIVDNFAAFFQGGNPQPVLDALVTNIETVISSIAAANPNVHQVIANVPDITVAPRFDAVLNSITPAQLQAGRDAIMAANHQIEQYALLRGAAVVDLFRFADEVIPLYPWTFGGHTFDTAFAPNELDILTQPEGIISNMIATAFNEGFGQNLPIFSDQQIVATSGFTPNSETTYYDVSRLVLLPVPEPATLSLAALGAAALLVCGRYSRPPGRSLPPACRR